MSAPRLLGIIGMLALGGCALVAGLGDYRLEPGSTSSSNASSSTGSSTSGGTGGTGGTGGSGGGAGLCASAGGAGGTSTCPKNLGDCDGLPGCEKNLSADPKSCGACVHDCLGGTCMDGKCQALELAAAQPDPGPIAVAGGMVYWAYDVLNSGTIRAVPIGATIPVPVAMNQGHVNAMAADETYLYFIGKDANGNYLRATELGGNHSVVDIASTSGSSIGLAVDAENLYWSSYEGLWRVAKLGNSVGPVKIADESGSMSAPVVDAQFAYWATSFAGLPDAGPAKGTIQRVSLTSGKIEPLAQSLTDPSAVAVDEAYLYWVDYTEGTLRRIPKAGGTPVVLATALQYPNFVLADATDVYWSSYKGTNIGRVSRCNPALRVDLSTNRTVGIVLDDKHLFWTDAEQTNAVWQLAK